MSRSSRRVIFDEWQGWIVIDAARRRILAACYKLMLPIARVLLANGFSYREFDEVCRRAFVETAGTQFGIRGRETNTSRIAAMTGLPRKQVQEVRKRLAREAFDSEEILSPLADLLQRWATSEEYQDGEGRPIKLKMKNERERSFAGLVQTCMGDVPPGAVKAELLRLGAIRALEGEDLELRRRSLIPEDVDTRLESAVLYSLKGLANTIAHNCNPIIGEHDRLFERFVESPLMSDAEVLQMRSAVRERLTKITEDLDSFLNAPSQVGSGVQSKRIGIGIYYCE